MIIKKKHKKIENVFLCMVQMDIQPCICCNPSANMNNMQIFHEYSNICKLYPFFFCKCVKYLQKCQNICKLLRTVYNDLQIRYFADYVWSMQTLWTQTRCVNPVCTCVYFSVLYFDSNKCIEMCSNSIFNYYSF